MKETANVKSGYLCHCLQISEARFDEILRQEGRPSYALLKERYQLGTVCSSCEYEAKGKLAEHLMLYKGSSRPSLRAAWDRLKRALDRPKPRQPHNYKSGIFFMRRDGLESHLVLSNLRFPEHAQNVNGAAVTIIATLYGEDGRELGKSAPVTVADNVSAELTPAQLFPSLHGDFTGWLLVEYQGLMATGSLRPYGAMVSTTPDFRARCHYHDKFGKFQEPGFIFSSSPLEPGQPVWMALASCWAEPYETTAHLKVGGQQWTTTISVPPLGARWDKVSALFPDYTGGPTDETALFWLEDPRHVMVYFFWYNEAARSWMGQHH